MIKNNISKNRGVVIPGDRKKSVPGNGFQPGKLTPGHWFQTEKIFPRESSNLKTSEILRFLEESVAGKVSVGEQVKFLADFTPEKVTAEDLKIFAEFMMSKVAQKVKAPDAIDICGTGGSGLNRINTSTIAAFILAQLGVGIAKHGNKAASGRVGSFDLLESLGIEIGKNLEELNRVYAKTGLAFIYARQFFPVMKFFAEARQAFGKPTIFNMLGPLLSPASVKKQIIGTSFRGQMRLLAEACKLLGKERVMIVCGDDYLDEVTLTGKTKVVELKDGKIFEYEIGPEDFGIDACKFKEIEGGSLAKNKKIALEILSGQCKSRHADLVYVNTALALRLVGRVEDLAEGYRVAKSVIGLQKLEAYKGNILAEIAASKLLPRSERSFFEALKEGSSKGKKALIAEIKFASPSEGRILKGNLSPRRAAEIARIYEENGASAISVLTDEKYFSGSFENLRAVKKATKKVPILCKDFIVSEWQIYRAREAGADAILLIAALLGLASIKKFLRVAENLEMDCLVEVHNEKELKKVLKTEAKIIGINNRDLKTFEIDLNTTNRLLKMIPKDKIVVSESGINSIEDLLKLDKRVAAVLVGTSLMKAKNIASAVKNLI